MTKRMLIDATHAEETRVVVLDGNRLEDFDVETAAKKQLKGNIYLAKVVRVEPSLQAAFVEYGGGRHGFLAFGEIHPDYYQIPVADRQRLLELQEAEARAEEEAEDAAAEAAEAAGSEMTADEMPANVPSSAEAAGDEPGEPSDTDMAAEPPLPMEEEPGPTTERPALAAAVSQDFIVAREEAAFDEGGADDAGRVEPSADQPGVDLAPEMAEPAAPDLVPTESQPEITALDAETAPISSVEPVGGEIVEPTPQTELPLQMDEATPSSVEVFPANPPPEMLDGSTQEPPDHTAHGSGSDADGVHTDRGQDDTGHDDEIEEAGNSEQRPSRQPARYMRSYKIQEVIRRRQILLVQVVKEERGTKGAALTTFISLAGRFSVLMPNSPRGGGISRKITSAVDRRRLKEVTSELQIPRGMGLIVRTAGANRPKAEIKRDCEYLLELWDSIRETTMASVAPAQIHEEASLIKRSIRDNYSRDVEEVTVDGEQGWRAARDFMRMLMPAHARKVVLWNEPQPLFAKHNVEAQLDAMLEPTVQLRSGGYLVINQTEALVAIDVNSGRSTRERGIEETALKTNLEAADEVARQLRLRDLAGLIVIDFIDMESRRNNAAVEKRIKDALKDDRARIQLGAISHFGLLELSRQRLRPSLAETSFTVCPHCGGTGHVRTTEMAALAVLRAVEEEGSKRRAAAIVVHVAGAVALYVLNHKRVRLAEIEARYGMEVTFAADESLLPPQTRIERVRAQTADALYAPAPMPALAPTPEEDDLAEEAADSDIEEEEETEPDTAVAGETAEEADTRHRKRRRRRRGGRRDDAPAALTVDPANLEQPEILPAAAETAAPSGEVVVEPETGDVPVEEPVSTEASGEDDGRGRRRGRRGGRRRRREPGEGEAPTEAEGEAVASFDAPPAPAYSYTGPTPANPFGGQAFDIFDMMDEPDVKIASPNPAPASPEPPPMAAPEHRPEQEGEAGEATVPAEPEAQAPQPELAAEPEAVVPAAIEADASKPAAPEIGVPEAGMLEASVLEAGEPEAGVPEVAVAEPTAAEEDAPLSNGHAPDPTPAAASEAEPAAEPVSAVLPPPVLVGSVPVTDKKRGWWRR